MSNYIFVDRVLFNFMDFYLSDLLKEKCYIELRYLLVDFMELCFRGVLVDFGIIFLEFFFVLFGSLVGLI